MADSTLAVGELQTRLREFARVREWEQFHSPKNLAMALVVEVAELSEIFQWLTPDESSSVRDNSRLKKRVSDEIADVLIYLLRLADALDVSLAEAVDAKIALNALKYPVETARGSAEKRTLR